MNVSVCMATYNGEKYIKQQLDSILLQLDIHDELIISDDGSTDATVDIIYSYEDKRMKIYDKQHFKSPIFNFENAIKQATNEIIVLADQDDIWEVDKLQIIKMDFKHINKKISLKMYNGQCINEKDEVIERDLFKYLDVREGLLENIKKNSFIGCNIAFTKNLLEVTLPFPKDIPMHDMWLGCNAYIYGEVKFIDKKIFNYRLHKNNYSIQNNSIFQKVKWRFQLVKNLIIRYINVKVTN